MSFIPKTRLEKILCGVAGAADNAKSRIEKAVAEAVSNAGSNAPLELTVTTSESGGKTVATFNKTAAEVFAAAAAGRPVIATTVQPVGETMVTITFVIPVEAFRSEVGSDTSYIFKSRCDIDSADKLYYGSDFAADDTVVLTEV